MDFYLFIHSFNLNNDEHSLGKLIIMKILTQLLQKIILLDFNFILKKPKKWFKTLKFLNGIVVKKENNTCTTFT